MQKNTLGWEMTRPGTSLLANHPDLRDFSSFFAFKKGVVSNITRGLGTVRGTPWLSLPCAAAGKVPAHVRSPPPPGRGVRTSDTTFEPQTQTQATTFGQ